MAPPKYYWSNLKLWAEIKGFGPKVDLVAVNIHYAIDGIPTATMRLAVGRTVEGSYAQAHNTINSNHLFEEISIKFTGEAKPDGRAGPGGASWPAAGTTIFKGYVVDPGYSSDGQTVGFTLAARGWLIDMDGSITSSRSYSNPDQHGFMGPPRYPGDMTATEKKDRITPQEAMGVHFNKMYSTNMWEMLKAAFTFLTSEAVWNPRRRGSASAVANEPEPRPSTSSTRLVSASQFLS